MTPSANFGQYTSAPEVQLPVFYFFNFWDLNRKACRFAVVSQEDLVVNQGYLKNYLSGENH